MIMKEKLNYFSSKNCNIVGMTTVKDIDNNEMLFALDDWGILNIYKSLYFLQSNKILCKK